MWRYFLISLWFGIVTRMSMQLENEKIISLNAYTSKDPDSAFSGVEQGSCLQERTINFS